MPTGLNYGVFHSKTGIQKRVISNNNFTYRLILQSLNEYIQPGMKVLDIGCGAGTLCLYLASKGYDVVGVDISDKAINSAKRSAEALNLQNTKFEVIKFPEGFPKGKFDFIIFTEVIEHLKDDKKAINKISLILNKNGILLMSTPSIKAPLHRIKYAKEFDKSVGHLRRYNIEQLSNLLNSNGLSVIKIRKVEGVLRNFLFLSPRAGKFVRFVKFFISDLITFVDNLTVPVLGESNYIIIAKKK